MTTSIAAAIVEHELLVILFKPIRVIKALMKPNIFLFDLAAATIRRTATLLATKSQEIVLHWIVTLHGIIITKQLVFLDLDQVVIVEKM